MIAWKVVTKTRRSCVVYRAYSLLYLKGETVKAGKDTLGVMCFKTRTDATIFAGNVGAWLILKVKGDGRKAKKPEWISRNYRTDRIREFYRWMIDCYSSDVVPKRPPTGTICFPEVEVLE